MEPEQDKKTTKKDWAEMDAEDVEQDEEIGEKEEPKKFSKGGRQAGGNAPKGKKNAQGDFIVTTFDVDTTVGLKKTVKDGDDEGSDSDRLDIASSDSDYGNEADQAEEESKGVEKIPEEPKKKEGK